MNSKLMKMMMNNRKKQEWKNNHNSIVNRIRVVDVPPRKQQPEQRQFPFAGAISAPEQNLQTQLLMANYSNFKRSAAPARFMYYENDRSWVDLPAEVFEPLKSGFVDGKPVVEVKLVGDDLCMFDFHRMLMIDLESGDQRSIAWIDVEGNCFFPRGFVCGGGKEFDDVDEGEGSSMKRVEDVHLNVEIARVTENLNGEKPKVEIELRIDSNANAGNRKRKCVESENKSEEVSQEKSEASSSSNNRHQRCDFMKKRQVIVPNLVTAPKWPKVKLLKEGNRAYALVKNLFLSGLRTVEPAATVTAIHQCVRTEPLDKVRYEVFQKQMQIIKAARGDSNMAFGWHGTSAEGVASILAHGFGMPTKIASYGAYGVGIYLSSARSPHVGALLSEADDNGEKHVILCRIILGKCEKIEAGSQQLYPSTVDFDTGVDDLENPKWFVVWGANMNTHILPECIVSYKPTDRVPGQDIFSKLGSSLPPPKAQELRSLWIKYKKGELAKHAFFKQLRTVVGDALLRSALREVQG